MSRERIVDTLLTYWYHAEAVIFAARQGPTTMSQDQIDEKVAHANRLREAIGKYDEQQMPPEINSKDESRESNGEKPTSGK
jgi:hypothetical protein